VEGQTNRMKAMEWNPELYTKKHAVIYEGGGEALAILAPRAGERILDLGCGTGQLTQAIAESGASVTGLDSSAAMIEAARCEFPGLPFVLADAADFAFPQPFDAVFSHATMHWVKPPEKAIECVARCLRKEGRFVAEFGGKGHITKLRRAVEATWREMTGGELEWDFYFPSVAEFSTLLEGAGLEVRDARLLEVPTKLEDGENGLRNFLTMFGAKYLRAVPESAREKWLGRAEEIARPELFREGSWYLDRRRVRVLAVKSESFS
jgi:SAM-dependent methyltransferase